MICPYGAIYIGPDGKAGVSDFYIDRLKRGKLPKCGLICPGEARIFGDLNDLESKVSKLVSSRKAQPILLKGVKKIRVYYIPSKHEPDFATLPNDPLFLEALKTRNKDLPPI